MISTTLSECLRLADDVEGDVRRIGTNWAGFQHIIAECTAFRTSCDAIATDRIRDVVTVAFVGPKNAGKTHLLSLLVRSDERRQQLRIGVDHQQATVRPTWIAAVSPVGFRAGVEEFIPCPTEDLELPCALLDVPGFDEARQDRQRAASRALEEARVKVLVVGRPELQINAWADYIEHVNGATVIPVITKACDLPPEDIAFFQQELRARLSRSPHVFDPIVMPHFTMEGADRLEIINATRRSLRESLASAVSQSATQASTEQELLGRQGSFRKRVQALAEIYLPATRNGLVPIDAALRTLPQRASDALLGDETALRARVRSSLRAGLLERTPVFVFPWRLTLSIANLVHGATDRLPLAMGGSLPSLLAVGWSAAKNVREGREFREEIQAGLRRRVEERLKDDEQFARKLQTLEANLDSDLGTKENPIITDAVAKCTIHLYGLEALQAASSGIFQRVVGTATPTALAAWICGLLGFCVFWGILGQPLYGLYQDFYTAAGKVLAREETAIEAFPGGTSSVLLTSTLLALVPMGLFLLFTVAWIARGSRVVACIETLRNEHRNEIATLTGSGVVRAELSEPRLDACRRLLWIEKTNSDECQKDEKSALAKSGSTI